MYQGTQGYSVTKKTEGTKSRETVPLKVPVPVLVYRYSMLANILALPTHTHFRHLNRLIFDGNKRSRTLI
jgi:hypothetical protein